MPRADEAYKEWVERLDGLAEQANGNLAACMARANRPVGPDADLLAVAATVASGALVAIASQLAYGNAVAAATFYMDNQLWTEEAL